IEVPNTLEAKARGKPLRMEELNDLIGAAMYEINDQRLKRHSYRIAAIVDQIVPAYQKTG
ncbi:MAG: hypothetical protein CMM59_23305, partial [Rhodospirillaceae bacterium]|nr:hypothetical protein [Rhodospirillaceae bacterium]